MPDNPYRSPEQPPATPSPARGEEYWRPVGIALMISAAVIGVADIALVFVGFNFGKTFVFVGIVLYSIGTSIRRYSESDDV